MDMRKWFLMQDRQLIPDFRNVIKHVPGSEYRSPSVLRLFLAGTQCDFKLTTHEGQPTPALRVMAEIMGAQLCQRKDLPDEERKGFGLAEPTLMNTFDDSWWLRGITDRVRAAQAATAMPMGRDKWHLDFLPGLDGAYITYKEDGKRRKRQCWIAVCPIDWEMNHHVYKGIWFWTRESLGPPEKFRGFGGAPWPDAYALLREDPTLRPGAGAGAAGRPVEATRAAQAQGVLEAPVGFQYGPAEGPHAAAGA